MGRPALAQGQASDCGSPLLDLYTTVNGERVDAAVVQYVIYEMVTNPLVPTQVYPPAGRADVIVDQFCDDGGGRLGLGHYLAEWLVPDDEPLGVHVIEWYFKLSPASQEFTTTESFDVVAFVGTTDATLYATLEEIRAAGVPVSKASDEAVLLAIETSSRLIDAFTGRWFYPRTMSLIVDGRGNRTIRLGHPIIDVTRVVIDYFLDAPEDGTEIPLSQLEVYNRHVRLGMDSPDDRNNPMVVVRVDSDTIKRLGVAPLGLTRIPKGKQNVLVEGVFGYTDYDGSATGCTPKLIRYACRMLVLEELLAGSPSGANWSGSIKREKTREQEIEFADPAKLAIQGSFTGNNKVDQILAKYRRPMALGSA